MPRTSHREPRRDARATRGHRGRRRGAVAARHAWLWSLPLLIGCAAAAAPQASEALSKGIDAVTPGAAGEGAPPAPADGHFVSEPVRRDRCGIPLAVSANTLLAPGAVEQLQDKLVTRGLLGAGQYANGELDEATLSALARVQEDQGLPVVRVPTYATVRALGLEPAAVFLSGDASCARARR